MTSRGLFTGAIAALASTAAMATTAAMAADLPVRKAAPVEYMRACTQYGPGFFFLPGTDTCLRVSGLVRADFVGQTPAFYSTLFPSPTGRVNQLAPRSANVIGMQARGQFDLDARTSTAYGALRTFISYRLYAGSLTGIGANPATGDVFTLTNFGGGGFQPPAAELGRAYVEFAGFTAGRAYSFFNLPYFETFSSPLTPDGANTMFAYTARFGQGWSLTVAAEDAGTRRSALRIGVGTNDPDLFVSRTGDFQAGNQYPMFVGALAYDNPMFSVQLSGAVREVRTNNLRAAQDAINGNQNNGPDPILGALILANRQVDDIGFAVQLGGQVRLPFIAAGDKLYGGINYSEGLALLSGIYIDEDRFGRPSGGYEDYEGTVDVLTGRFVRTKFLSGHLGFLHYWAPTLRSAISGSVMRVDDSNFADRLISYDRYRAIANLVWSPVAGLDIGAEAMYDKIDFGNPFQANSFDQFTGTVRVQRRF